MGLGPWPAVSLAEARKAPEKAREALVQLPGTRPQRFAQKANGSFGPAHIRLQVSDFDSLGDLQGVFQLDAKIPDGAVHFRMAEKELNRP